MELTNLKYLAVLLLALLYACNGLSTLQRLNASTPNISTTSFPCKKIHSRFLRSNNFEGFSSPMGTWKVVDGSQQLGPKEDHTYGTSIGHYAVVSGNVSEVPLLGSYLFVFCEPICLSFHYSMPGSGSVTDGGLDVISGPFGSNNVTTVASIYNYSSDGWHQSKVTLRPGNVPLIYKLKGRLPDPKGSFSLAIDDISYTRGECIDETTTGPLTTTPDPSTTASTCKRLDPRFLRSNNFEDFFSPMGTWKIVDGSQYLGPKEDHTYGTSAGHYAVVSGNVSEVPLLGSYLFVFCEPICLFFYYSMPGKGHVTDGGLDLISGPFGSDNVTTVASIDSYSSDGWHQSNATLRPGNVPLIYKLRGRSPDPTGSFSLALDDISYTRGECTDEITSTSVPLTTTSGMETTTEPLQSPTTGKDSTSESSETTSVHSISSLMSTLPVTNPPSESTTPSQLSLEANPTTGHYTTTNIIGTTAENLSSQTTVGSTITNSSVAASTVTHNIMVNATVNINTTPVTTKPVSATKTAYYQNTTLNASASQTAPYNSTLSSILTEVTNSTTSVSISATTSTSKMASTSVPASTSVAASTSVPASTSVAASTSVPGSTSVTTSATKITPAFATSPTTQITSPTTHLTKSTTSIGASGDNNKQNKNDSSKETPWFTWVIAGVAGVLVVSLIIIALVVWRRRRRGKTVLEPVRTYSMNSKPFDDDLAVGNPLYGENESTPV